MKNIVSALGLLLCLALSSQASAGPIDSLGGSKFLYLSTGPGDNPGGVDEDSSGNGIADYDHATFSFEFTTTGSQDFLADVNVLTSEYSDPEPIPDFFGVFIDGAPVEAITPLGPGISLYAVVEPNGTHTSVIPSFAFSDTPMTGPDGSIFLDGQTEWLTFIIPAAALSPGLHTLSLRLTDESDPVIDTAILIDNLRLYDGESFGFLNDFESDDVGTPPAFGTVSGNAFVAGDEGFVDGVSVVPEPSTLTLAAIGLFAGLGYVRRRKS
ncbi:MAG: PEP-CTERM sorting domain-containing protein [Planctomycetaceae bacterium]